ncbi:MAG: hypothetical protein RLZ28_348 [Actinomycetota bacterium]
MNEKTQLSRRIKFYLVGLSVLAAPLVPLAAVALVAPIYLFVIIWIWPLLILGLVFALVLFVNAMIILSRVGRLYPLLKGSTIFGRWAAAAYPVLCLFIYPLAASPNNEIDPIVQQLFNPITFALALMAIHAIIIRRANNVIKADLAQVAP